MIDVDAHDGAGMEELTMIEATTSLVRPEEFRRASGDMICHCGFSYYKHRLSGPVGYDGLLFLRRLCNGDLVKL